MSNLLKGTTNHTHRFHIVSTTMCKISLCYFCGITHNDAITMCVNNHIFKQVPHYHVYDESGECIAWKNKGVTPWCGEKLV